MIEVFDIPLQKWIFVSVVVTQNAIEVYIDGRLIKTMTFQTNNLNNLYDTNILLGDPYGGF